jgi:hypothetical protein
VGDAHLVRPVGEKCTDWGLGTGGGGPGAGKHR